MHFTSTLGLGRLALLSLVEACPNALAHLEHNLADRRAIEHPTLNKRVAFDAASQLVDVTGEHAFVPPGIGDQRGPCPGLNAMANHGYLPHNGIATIEQFIEGTGQVFGMGVDLATVLAVYGAVFDGNLLEWSIGGPDLRVSSLGVLGEPQGILDSHNKYEGDASATRADLYEAGNDYLLQLPLFQALYDLGKEKDNYDLQLLTDYRATRFQDSIDNNPYFFNAPFSGVIAEPAAYSFVYRFMANKSAEFPEGQLNGEVLKAFYSITGDDGSFTYTPGHEHIPENWYTRNALDPYTLPYIALDGVSMLLQYPEFASIGGNTGTTNSFVGVDIQNLTSNVYSADTLTQGNNLICLGMELTIQEAPDILSGLYLDIDAASNKLGSVFGSATSSLGCPQLIAIDKGQFSQFPGYTKHYGGYTPPDSSLL